jgi:hypothetical protein
MTFPCLLEGLGRALASTSTLLRTRQTKCPLTTPSPLEACSPMMLLIRGILALYALPGSLMQAPSPCSDHQLSQSPDQSKIHPP